MSRQKCVGPRLRLHRQRDRAPIVDVFLAAMLAAAMVLVPGMAEAAGRRAAMAIDANTGRVLYAQGADEVRYPASLTKLMTLYLVFEQIEAGRLSPRTRIKISENAAGTPPSRLGLRPGDEIALGDAVKALITKSANDVAVAVAEHIAGSEAHFARLMTRKAHELGMSRTTFRNPHGLPDSAQVTTARDMLTLAMRLSDDFPRQYSLFSLRVFHYAGRAYRNHNTMLGYYRGMDGLKTGYTTSSGFNLVTSVRRGGRHVVAVVFGGSSAAARNVQMRAMLDRALPRASTHRTRQRAEPKLVAELRPANRPAHHAARASEPRLIEPVRQVAEPRHQRTAPTVQNAVAAAPRAQAPRVHIAKVRSVRIEPVSLAPASPQPSADDAPVAMAPQRIAHTLPAAPIEPPHRQPSRLAGFAQPSTIMDTSRGSAPSTFEEQARRLAEGQSPVAPPHRLVASRTSLGPPPSGLGRPERPAEHMAAGNIAVQIGAYASAADADGRLKSVQSANAGLLSNARPMTETVQVKGRTLYRARFVGFDPQGASRVCTELRRVSVDCHVTR